MRLYKENYVSVKKMQLRPKSQLQILKTEVKRRIPAVAGFIRVVTFYVNVVTKTSSGVSQSRFSPLVYKILLNITRSLFKKFLGKITESLSPDLPFMVAGERIEDYIYSGILHLGYIFLRIGDTRILLAT